MANQLLSDFIHNLAKQSGVDVTSEEFKLFMSDPKLVELHIDDKFTQQIQDSHLTYESAKNNSDLQKHFVGSTLSGIDNAMRRALKTIGAPEELSKVLESEETTLKKAEALIGKLKEVYDKPHDDPDAEKVRKQNQELATKVNELTEQINLYPEKMQEFQDTVKREYEDKMLGYEITGKLSGYNLNSTLPREDIYTLVRNKIGAMPYTIRKVDGELKVYQKDNPELLAQKDNKTLTMQGLLDSLVEPYVDKGGEPPKGDPKRLDPPEPPSRGAQSSLAEKMQRSAGAERKPAFKNE